MNPNRFQEAKRIYGSALEIEPGKREVFLKEACAGDESLRKEVESLLACQPEAKEFFKAPAMEAGAKALANEPQIDLTGRTLLHFSIAEKIGEGGMGVVYKARDIHLDRSVALKVLPSEAVADPERKRRFVQEAKSASALNHPNIIQIHDINSDGGVDFIVMEYVAGKTLDRRIGRRGLPLGDALKYGVQIADGLAAAHAAGIIHRDLKPANVMVSEKGLIKILDFGLAKLTQPMPSDISGDVTAMKSLTEEGRIMGTVAYMSPEQAEGKPVDARSDIFSFGSMLYEMLTGQRAFRGDTKAFTIAAILKEEPKPVSQVTEGLPREVERIVKRCLRKDPEHRFQTMADLKVALEELKEESDSGSLEPARAAKPKQGYRLIWALGLAAALVIAVVGVWLVRSNVGVPKAPLVPVPLTSFPGSESYPSFSSDGNQVAFSWDGPKEDNPDIYVQMIGSGGPLRLTSDPARDYAPAFSPDGRRLAFVRQLPEAKCGIYLVPPLGGPERKVIEVSVPQYPNLVSVSWSMDGRWLVVPDSVVPGKPAALFLVSVESGEKRPLTAPRVLTDEGDLSAAFSPDGRTMAFTRYTVGIFGDIYLLALDENLIAQGEPLRLTTENRGISRPAWTADGNEVVYSSGISSPTATLWRIQASGQGKPRRLDFAGEGASGPTLSRFGQRLAYARYLQDINIWAVGATGLVRRFISSTRADFNPQFSADGKRIAFGSERSGTSEIWVCDADASNAVQLTFFGGPDIGTPRWAPGGDYIVFDSMAAGNRDIYVVSAAGGKPRAPTTEPSQDKVPSWSHDGRWIYFASNRGGDDQIWRMPWVPSGSVGRAEQVTRNGGYVAFESFDGKDLYYTKNGQSGPLFKLPLLGGTESKVLESVYRRAFTVTEKGIYFIAAPDVRGVAFLKFFEFAAGKTRQIAALDQPLHLGLTVSPDGKTILYSQFDQSGSDLMLVENFR